MYFEEGHVYHVYNKGNNAARIFFTEENYLFFLRKIRKEIKPICELLAYCLMPNHFHFMLQATAKSCETTKQDIPVLARKLGTLLSSYSQAINKQQNTTGSLFQQKTKAKYLRQTNSIRPTAQSGQTVIADYALACFFYIHNNPVKANLVKKAQEWQYSSYADYLDLRNGTLCNKKLAFEILGIEKESLEDYMNKDFEGVENIW